MVKEKNRFMGDDEEARALQVIRAEDVESDAEMTDEQAEEEFLKWSDAMDKADAEKARADGMTMGEEDDPNEMEGDMGEDDYEHEDDGEEDDMTDEEAEAEFARWADEVDDQGRARLLASIASHGVDITEPPSSDREGPPLKDRSEIYLRAYCGALDGYTEAKYRSDADQWERDEAGRFSGPGGGGGASHAKEARDHAKAAGAHAAKLRKENHPDAHHAAKAAKSARSAARAAEKAATPEEAAKHAAKAKGHSEKASSHGKEKESAKRGGKETSKVGDKQQVIIPKGETPHSQAAQMKEKFGKDYQVLSNPDNPLGDVAVRDSDGNVWAAKDRTKDGDLIRTYTRVENSDRYLSAKEQDGPEGAARFAASQKSAKDLTHHENEAVKKSFSAKTKDHHIEAAAAASAVADKYRAHDKRFGSFGHKAKQYDKLAAEHAEKAKSLAPAEKKVEVSPSDDLEKLSKDAHSQSFKSATYAAGVRQGSDLEAKTAHEKAADAHEKAGDKLKADLHRKEAAKHEKGAAKEAAREAKMSDNSGTHSFSKQVDDYEHSGDTSAEVDHLESLGAVNVQGKDGEHEGEAYGAVSYKLPKGVSHKQFDTVRDASELVKHPDAKNLFKEATKAVKAGRGSDAQGLAKKAVEVQKFHDLNPSYSSAMANFNKKHK